MPETTVSLLSLEDAAELWDFEQYNTAIYALEHNGFTRSTQQAPNARRQVFEIEVPSSYEALLMEATCPPAY